MEKGKFVISLDFEIYWGVRDKRTLQDYGESLKKVHEIVPRMLKYFDQYGARATFATVGFLFAKTKKELLEFSPKKKPDYQDNNLSPYDDSFIKVKETYNDDPYHFAPNLINLILNHQNHELGTHTFSHFYCLEHGQSSEDFRNDLEAAIGISAKYGNQIKSIVFPRNQVNMSYLDICEELGVVSYRGTEKVWFNRADSEADTSLFKKIFRTLDCYLNISGYHTYSMNEVAKVFPYNIRSSRFLRPYNSKLGFLEFLKLNRIKRAMTHAAKKGEIFHLWWHPHNFGNNTEKNFKNLLNILKHYSYLKRVYDFDSCTMLEVAKDLDSHKDKSTMIK
ncbi:polysaccharide deacetylase family protein [Flagellimonas olearia]|nr:polysaccharide deacetylase family protein [Allomuricauda olearia]